MMATRKNLQCFAVLLILKSTESLTHNVRYYYTDTSWNGPWSNGIVTDTLTTSRHKRAAFVVKALTFAYQKLASFGTDEVLKKELDDRTSKKLDDIIKSLDTIESLKENPSFVKAREMEAKLVTKMYNYQTLLKSFQHSGNNETQKTIAEFKKSLREVPELLFQLDLLITGKSRVAAGLLPGLVSYVVDQQLNAMKTASQEVYNVTRTVQEILEYQNILITLQLASIQIYFNNCPDPSSICQIKLNDINDRIASQVKLFERLFPGMFELMTRGKNSSVYITDSKTNGMLYSNQKSSTVKDGKIDWERIESTQDAGLKCPRQDAKEKWTLEDASGVGRAGFFLKQESGCFLSIDRPFMDQRKSFPLIWTDSDRIDRYKFLICLPNLTPDAVTFFLHADASSVDTTYTLMATHSAIPANRYLKVEEKKTSVYEKINRRLFLTLFLSDKAESWSVGSEITKSTCDDSAVARTVNREEDNGIKIAIGAGVGVIILIVIICICYFKCRNSYYFRHRKGTASDCQRDILLS